MPRIDLFTTVHKGIRWWMSGLSTRLGSTAFSDPAVPSLLADLEELLTALDEHALHEDTFIAPYLLARASDRALPWQEDHRHFAELAGGLREQVRALHEVGPAADAAGIWLSLYRGFNRFMAETLRHLDEEETRLMPALWAVCTDEELQALMQSFKARFGAEALKFHARVAAAYAPAERSLLGV